MNAVFRRIWDLTRPQLFKETLLKEKRPKMWCNHAIRWFCSTVGEQFLEILSTQILSCSGWHPILSPLLSVSISAVQWYDFLTSSITVLVRMIDRSLWLSSFIQLCICYPSFCGKGPKDHPKNVFILKRFPLCIQAPQLMADNRFKPLKGASINKKLGRKEKNSSFSLKCLRHVCTDANYFHQTPQSPISS